MAEQPKKKQTWKIVLFGGLGAGVLLYAALRAPRYLFEGLVESCEGGGADCTALTFVRGQYSGKLFAPFGGNLVVTRAQNSTRLVLHSDKEPVIFNFEVPAGTQVAGGRIKAGALIAQATRVSATATYQGKVMSPSTWLVTNAIAPTQKRTDKWCEDRTHLIVPKCEGVDFVPPTLPKFSLRAIQVVQ